MRSAYVALRGSVIQQDGLSLCDGQRRMQQLALTFDMPVVFAWDLLALLPNKASAALTTASSGNC